MTVRGQSLPYHRLMPPTVTPDLVLDRATARRFLVLRHLLAPPRGLPPEPESVLTVMARLGSLQFDPLDIAGRNHDLVLASRIAGYQRAWTDAYLYETRTFYETYNKGLSLVPTADLPWYRVTWDLHLASHDASTFTEHADLVEELLGRIRRDGPLSSTDVEPRAAIDWYWRPTNQVRAILEALAEAGVLGLARREGNRRVYDLAERLFPAALLDERHDQDDQRRHKLRSRYQAHGLLGSGGQAEIWLGIGKAVEWHRRREELLASGEILPVEVDGTKGVRYMVAVDLPFLEQARREIAAGLPPGGVAPGVAFLAALDPLVWDRELLRRLWDFDYVWEVYVPAAKRRWGYYVLPLLFGDRLVGRIEPRADRKARSLRIVDLWWEDGFDPLAADGFVDALGEALVAHARFVGATRVVWPRVARHRALGERIRALLGVGGKIPPPGGSRS
jgi:uncharacterized protein